MTQTQTTFIRTNKLHIIEGNELTTTITPQDSKLVMLENIILQPTIDKKYSVFNGKQVQYAGKVMHQGVHYDRFIWQDYSGPSGVQPLSLPPTINIQLGTRRGANNVSERLTGVVANHDRPTLAKEFYKETYRASTGPVTYMLYIKAGDYSFIRKNHYQGILGANNMQIGNYMNNFYAINNGILINSLPLVTMQSTEESYSPKKYSTDTEVQDIKTSRQHSTLNQATIRNTHTTDGITSTLSYLTFSRKDTTTNSVELIFKKMPSNNVIYYEPQEAIQFYTQLNYNTPIRFPRLYGNAFTNALITCYIQKNNHNYAIIDPDFENITPTIKTYRQELDIFARASLDYVQTLSGSERNNHDPYAELRQTRRSNHEILNTQPVFSDPNNIDTIKRRLYDLQFNKFKPIYNYSTQQQKLRYGKIYEHLFSTINMEQHYVTDMNTDPVAHPLVYRDCYISPAFYNKFIIVYLQQHISVDMSIPNIDLLMQLFKAGYMLNFNAMIEELGEPLSQMTTSNAGRIKALMQEMYENEPHSQQRMPPISSDYIHGLAGISEYTNGFSTSGGSGSSGTINTNGLPSSITAKFQENDYVFAKKSTRNIHPHQTLVEMKVLAYRYSQSSQKIIYTLLIKSKRLTMIGNETIEAYEDELIKIPTQVTKNDTYTLTRDIGKYRTGTTYTRAEFIKTFGKFQATNNIYILNQIYICAD